jgi:hypothetical protein
LIDALKTIGTSNAFSTTKRCSLTNAAARLLICGRHGRVEQLAVAVKLDSAGVEIGVLAEQVVVFLAGVRKINNIK